DEKIDCVYISLPNHLHKETIIKALQKGKAVLSEKPAVLKKEDLKEIEEVSKEKSVLFMEAMKTRFMPAYIELKKRLEEGVIGKIRHIDTRLIFPAGRGGLGFHPEDEGLFYGCGIYNAGYYADFLPGTVPVSLSCQKEGGEPVYLRALLEKEGHYSVLEVGMDDRKYSEATIYGEKGYIVVPDFHRPLSFTVCRDVIDKVEMPCEYGDFYPEIHHFTACLKKGRRESPVMKTEDSLACLMILGDIIKLL
nr:Gfo/Idh/MocA family oxidoreductase [Solobacterium sp.]